MSRFLVTLALAWLATATMRSTAGRISDAAWDAIRSAIKDATHLVVLRILLPSTAVIAVIQGQLPPGDFARLMMLGFTIAMVLYAMSVIGYRIVLGRNSIWRAQSAASMGGGNRGLAALLLLAGIVYAPAPGREELLTTAKASFLAIDLGNFVALLFCFPFLTTLIMRSDGPSSEPKLVDILSGSLHKARWDLLVPLGGFILVCMVMAWPTPVLREAVDRAARETDSVRSILLSFLTWLHVFVVASPFRSFAGPLGEATILLFMRTLLAIATAVVGGWLVDLTAFEFVATPRGLALSILLLAPVSSVAPFVARQAGADDRSAEDATLLVIVSTVLFIALTVVLAVVLVAQ